MIRIFFVVWALFAMENISAQSTIQGTITDSKTGKPIERAVVLLFRQGEKMPFKQDYSNEKGQFRIQAEVPANFTMRVQFLGYDNYEKSLTAQSATKPLKIQLKGDANQIQTVQIEGTRARATLKEDTIVYDAQAFKTYKDATVEDLVKKMPGITSENGVIKSNGEQVQRVTVDGQSFFGDDANIALRNLPAETVDKVEVFDARSDRADFTGFDDGNTTKTINLKTKANRKEGYFGKAYAGYGTNDRYQGGGNLNYFDGATRLSVLGLANNINNLNFSSSEIIGAVAGTQNTGNSSMNQNMSFGMRVSGGGGGGPMGGSLNNFTVSNQNGVNKAYSLGTNYNDVWGKNRKTKIAASVFTNRTDNYTATNSQAKNFVSEGNTLLLNTNQVANAKIFDTKFNVRMDGILDERNSYAWVNAAEITDNTSNTNKSVTNQFQNSTTQNLQSAQTINSHAQNVSFSSSFIYKFKFLRTRRTFSFNPILQINTQDGGYTQNSSIFSGTSSSINYQNTTNQWSATVTGALSYTEPSGTHGQWMVNYTPSASFQQNRILMYTSPSTTNFTFDSAISSVYGNPIFYNTGGFAYRMQFEKWKFMFGINAQNINFKGEQQLTGNATFSRNFFGVLPYFNIEYKPQKMYRIRLNYTTALNVPSMSNLQPYLDVSNPNSLYKGNVNLQNEYNHNLLFMLMKPNIVKGTFFMVRANLIYTKDKIANSTFTAIQDTAIEGTTVKKGVQYNTSVNMDNYVNGSFFTNYTMPVKFLKSNISGNAAFTYTHTPSMINGNTNLANSYVVSLGAILTSNISENIDFSIGYNPKLTATNYTLFAQNNNSYWTQSVISNFKCSLLDNFVFNTDFSYNYNSQINPALNQHVFLWGASLAYKVLKARNLEIKASVFDLLDQNRNISRSVTANAITDTRINAMNRYFMMTATYTFKKFKSGESQTNENPFFRSPPP